MPNRQLSLNDTDKVEDLIFEPLNPKFLKVKFINTTLIYIIMMGIPLSLLFITGFAYRIHTLLAIEFCLLTAAVINLSFLPKAFAYKGFAIREHDITYRSGWIIRKTTTIPFCKIQQISIRQSPLPRLFGLYTVDVVDGAQMLESTSIPGLEKERAYAIKTLLTERVKHENS